MHTVQYDTAVQSLPGMDGFTTKHITIILTDDHRVRMTGHNDKKALNIKIRNKQRIFFDKLAPRFHLFTHECCEYQISFNRVFKLNAHEAS